MFADGFIAEHIFEILGLLVTVGGVWLVVKQLNETRLASQMEGILALGDRFDGIVEHNIILFELSQTTPWKEANNSKAHKIIFESKRNREAFFKVTSFYEALAVLVRRRVVDKQLAIDNWGDMVGKRWTWIEKAVLEHRRSLENEKFSQHWEWMAKEFENYPE